MFLLSPNARDIPVKRFAAVLMLHLNYGSVFLVSESQILCQPTSYDDKILHIY